MKTFTLMHGFISSLATLALCFSMSCGGGGGSTPGGNTNPPPTPTPTAAAPAFSPAAGTFSQAQTVTVSSTTAGATIYYTTDGSTPTAASTKYTAALAVSSSTTIKAIATASGYKDSAVASATYTISLPQAATPAFSPAGGNYTGAQTVTITDATSGATIRYTTDGSTPTVSSATYASPIAVSSSQTIKAIAVASGYTDSAVASATYTITQPPPSYTWKNVEITAGGFITGIVFHPAQEGLMYTRTDIGGAYRWDTTSKRWIPLTDWVGMANSNYLGIEAIGLDPSDPQRLYLAAGTYTEWWAGNGAILVSTDQGRTFQTVPMPFKMGGNNDGRFAGERLAVDPESGNIVYFGSRKDGLWKSVDHGAHWAKVSNFPASGLNGAGIVFIDFVKQSGNQGSATRTIYVGVSDAATHLYRSTDAGQTWGAVPDQPAGLFVNHGVFGPDGSLYLSYGNNIGPNGMTDGAIYKYTPDPSDPAEDGTWTNITPGILPYENGNGTRYGHGWGCVAVDQQRPGVIMASTMDLWWLHDGFVRSTDGGQTWIDLGETSVRDASLSPYLKWGGSAAGVGNWLGTLAIDPFDSGHVLYGTGATIWASSNVTNSEPGSAIPGLQVLRGGATNWTVGAAGIEETAVLQLISPPSGAHLVSGLGDINGFVHDDLTKSPAGGMMSVRFTTVTGLDFAQNNPAIMARVGDKGSSNGPNGAYTSNGGTSWTAFASHPTTTNGGAIAVSANGSRFVWSANDGKVYVTTNNGAAWTASNGTPAQKAVVADRFNPLKFYIFDASASSLYVSENGGVSFAKVIQSMPNSGSLVASFAAEGDLWVASNAGLYHSTNSGASFSRLSSVQEGYSVGFGKAADGANYPALYLAGKVAGVQAIFRSTDAGASWIRINDDQHQYGWINPVVGDPRIFGRVYLGTNGRGIVYGDSAY